MPKQTSRNGSWRSWALGVITTALVVVIGTLFCTWQGAAVDYGQEVTALRGEVAATGTERHALDTRITRMEENLDNIDKNLGKIDRKLEAIERAVK